MSLKKESYQLTLGAEVLRVNLNPNHELVILANQIDWDTLTYQLQKFFKKTGRHAKRIRLMVGLLFLKHLYNLSDRTVVMMLSENFYFKHFCGLHYQVSEWSKDKPVDDSTLTKFRRRLGKEGMQIVEDVIKTQLYKEGRISRKTQLVDTTAQACAGWPATKVLAAYASGYDGAGAQSVFIIAAQGRKRALAALLFKQGIGVRDAWVDHGGTQPEIDAELQVLAMQMDLLPVSLEYIAIATRHFLGVSAQAGILPPYGLLEVAELAGLTSVNPDFQPVDALLPSLCSEIASRRTTPQAIAKALKTSALWSKNQPIVWSWFEESDEVDAILAQGKLSKAKRKAALLAMPIEQRRRWWATLIAWTAYTMKEGGASGWEDYALVARELLGERPLDEFGIMNEIAEATLSNHSGR